VQKIIFIILKKMYAYLEAV